MAPPNLTVGALEIGVIISTFLFGISTVQTHTYFRRFPRDGWIIKSLVTLIWFLELAHTISITHGLFSMTVLQYISPKENNGKNLQTGFSVAIIFSGSIAAFVQAYYTHRLRVVSGQIAFAIFFWTCSLVRLGGWIWAGSTSTIACVQYQAGERPARAADWPLIPLLAFGALVDFVVAVSICHYFYTSRKRAGKQTVRLLDQLILSTIQNGALTSIAGIVTAVLLATMPDNFIWIVVFIILTRIFAISFLGSVNDRTELRKIGTDYQEAATRESDAKLKLSSSPTPV
ncbi:hypothetical protein BDZ94DRAFT_1260705 [Collybia nuda]|uniref:DUF6534 domain-containing protein n=1 Tax=Collybia nuda TaxID=64659 RepID=A0A9P6CJD4_9AGAR|nr:hypothetical protein BDZ94DRAFT_1260705 [Collybia nuda]